MACELKSGCPFAAGIVIVVITGVLFLAERRVGTSMTLRSSLIAHVDGFTDGHSRADCGSTGTGPS
jgi:hypothetical protein